MIRLLEKNHFCERLNFIQAYRLRAVNYFPFGSTLAVMGLLSKGRTSENKGSNVLSV